MVERDPVEFAGDGGGRGGAEGPCDAPPPGAGALTGIGDGLLDECGLLLAFTD